MRRRCLSLIVLLALLLPASAGTQASLDPVGLAPMVAGHGKVRLTVSAGPSGAPNGFTVWWMTRSQFQSCGGLWPANPIAGEGRAVFDGVATLHTWGAAQRSFQLGPGESLQIEIGDLFDETGVTGTVADELSGGEDYVFSAFANGSPAENGSTLSLTVENSTTVQGQNCTYTDGYWKNHPESWPVSSLVIGTVTYTAAQLLQILNQPTQGNGLVSLAHQLIPAKLNLANGADGSTIAGTISAADALIGALVIPPIGSGSLAPSQTRAYTQTLGDFNNGIIGPGHCPGVRARQTTWGGLKGLFR